MQQPFQKIELRKVRDFGAKFNATFEFIRQNYKALFTALLYLVAPFLVVVNLIAVVDSYNELGSVKIGVEDEFMSQFTPMKLLNNFLALLGYVLTSAVIFNFVKLYEKREDPLTIKPSEVWSEASHDLLPIFGAGLAALIVGALGLVLLVIPGIYVLITLSLISSVIVFEGKSIGDAFNRCFFLIKEKWWSTFGLLFVAVIIQYVIIMAFGLPLVAIGALLGYHMIEGGGVAAGVPLWIQVVGLAWTVIVGVASALISSILYIAIAFQYFNLVERRESTGLLGKVDSFGKQQSSAEQGDTY
jgi:hypothetical protein